MDLRAEGVHVSMDFEEALALLDEDAVIALYGFYDETDVKRWFHTRTMSLDNFNPYEVLMTVYGYPQMLMDEHLADNAIERVNEAAMELLGCNLL